MADDHSNSDKPRASTQGLDSDLELDTSGFEPGLELDKSGRDREVVVAHDDPEPVADGLELDTAGFEPGLELDKSGFASHPAPDVPGPVASATAGPAPLAPQPLPERPRDPRIVPPGTPRPRPKALAALAIGAAVIVVAIFAATQLGDPEPPPNLIPQQTLMEGERAFHQGKWVEALDAFQRLRRFPNSPEAESVRERGLEERAFREVMEAEPSSTSIRRLEDLSELYPDRPEVRDRLGEVRKALSSGARVAPDDEGQDEHDD